MDLGCGTPQLGIQTLGLESIEASSVIWVPNGSGEREPDEVIVSGEEVPDRFHPRGETFPSLVPSTITWRIYFTGLDWNDRRLSVSHDARKGLKYSPSRTRILRYKELGDLPLRVSRA